MIEINILTIEHTDDTLSFEYTLDGEQLNYKNKSTQSSWTIEELKELARV